VTAYIGSHFGPNRFFERDGTCKSSVIDLTTRERLKMYKRILLAYDGSVEGRTALREGALLARQCGADVFLLSVLVDTGTLLLPEAGLAGAFVHMEDDFTDILNEGVARLRKLGFDPTAKLVRGQPAEEIGNVARQIGADLIVVGHRRQSAFDRWWSGPKGAYLMDYTDCSLLVARKVISDEAIEAAFMTSGRTNG
jgi:nucleotide-binding universal stress UspA family protein